MQAAEDQHAVGVERVEEPGRERFVLEEPRRVHPGDLHPDVAPSRSVVTAVMGLVLPMGTSEVDRGTLLVFKNSVFTAAVPGPASRSCWRSRNFWTFPDAVRGNSGTATIDSGHFWRARPAAARWRRTSSSVGAAAPARTRTTAAACSPSRASGSATTQTSATASMPATSSSISAALMFSPPRMMTSEMRSVMVR